MIARVRSFVGKAWAGVRAMTLRQLVFLTPVLVVAVVAGLLIARPGDESTVTTKEDMAAPKRRIVSTSDGKMGDSAKKDDSAKKETSSTRPKKPASTTAAPAPEEPANIPVSDEAAGKAAPHLLPVLPPEPWPQGCCAPLTNLGFDSAEGAVGPAVAVKVSNSPEADPHTNLHRADLIYELQAEDVSRFIAVYHSRAADVIGPIRSGRTADPLIIKSLGRPMLVFSGGNDYVMAMMEARENDGTLVRMLTRNAVDSFFRSDDRRMPHNFYGHRPGWVAARGAEALPAHRQTDFFGDGGQVNTVSGQPVKVSVDIGRSDSWWQWDDTSQMWLRFQHGRPHVDKDSGYQIGRTSVIILGTDYPPSPADRRSPEAVSTGSGEAWVMTGRDFIHGSWSRSSPEDTWHLADFDGNPIRLKSGPVYIGLTGVKPVIE